MSLENGKTLRNKEVFQQLDLNIKKMAGLLAETSDDDTEAEEDINW